MTDSTIDAQSLTLYVVRHAEAAMRAKDEQDSERALTSSGESCAKKNSKLFHSQMPLPTLVLTSPATRTDQTASLLAEGFDYAADQIVTEARLYNADLDTILEVIQLIDAEHQCIMLVGHNPGVTDLVNYFSSQPVDPMGTCTIHRLQFSLDMSPTWANLQAHTATAEEIA